MDLIDQSELTIVAQKRVRKLGERSTGHLDYRILVDSEGTQLYLAITGNEGGGYFSREAVPIAAIRDCLALVGSQGAFLVRVLRPAFSGRSSNNPGFLSAALRAEGLIAPMDTPNRYVETGEWEAWTERYLAAEALDRQDDPPPVAVPKISGKAGKAGKARKARKSAYAPCHPTAQPKLAEQAGNAGETGVGPESPEAEGGDVDTNP